MHDLLQASLQQNNSSVLAHTWGFWHDRQDCSPANVVDSQPSGSGAQEEHLIRLRDIADLHTFWNVFNSFDIAKLPLRDSVHLFHKGIKPVWEDPCNKKGGSWTFRVPGTLAPEFWKEVCIMAIDEKLQACVENERTTLRDGICGISLGVRYNSTLVQIWNREGSHTTGIDSMLENILATLSPNLRPPQGSYYYKMHSEQGGFAASAKSVPASSRGTEFDSRDTSMMGAASSNPELLFQSSIDAPGITKSAQPSVMKGGTYITEKGKNKDAVEDMRYVLNDMKDAMDSVGTRGPLQDR